MRETEGFRPQLELLVEMFPARAAITVNECQAALGLDRRTLLADRTFPAKKIQMDDKKIADHLVTDIIPPKE